MPRTPVILIHTSANVDDFAKSIMDGLDSRYHQPGNAFKHYQMSDEETGEQESLSSAAAHASDLHVSNGHVYDEDGHDLGKLR